MNVKTVRWLAIVLVATALAGGARADDAGRKQAVVVLKYADGHAMQRMVQPYLTDRGRVQWVGETRALMVSDDPATVDVILKMVARFDVAPPQYGFSIRLVQAATGSVATPMPADLAPVAKQLGEVFRFNQYSVIDTAYVATEGARQARVQVGGEAGYLVTLDPRPVEGQDAVRVELTLSRDGLEQRFVEGGDERSRKTSLATVRTSKVLFSSALELRDGETTIVGASRPDNDTRALVCIVSVTVRRGGAPAP